ncbi:MAG: hypothetical protein H6Q92_1975 [Nitrospirae bacterium]|nr:hypothetical protein [Nitrospirota bacterium]
MTADYSFNSDVLNITITSNPKIGHSIFPLLVSQEILSYVMTGRLFKEGTHSM